MSIHQTRSITGQLVLNKYRQRGVFCGGGLGLLVGLLVSGPHFYEWSPMLAASVILGSAAAGAAIGWLFASAVVGFASANPEHGEGPEDIGGRDASNEDASV
jgi:hypothetical protein